MDDISQPSPGIDILSLDSTPQGDLVLTLNEPLQCPACGRHGATWTVPQQQGTTPQQRVGDRHKRHEPGS
jgi:hypothetical protein